MLVGVSVVLAFSFSHQVLTLPLVYGDRTTFMSRRLLFSLAPVVVLTKMDLAPHLEWSLPKCREYLRKIRPGVFIFELSARTGQGMDAWIEYLEKLAV